MNTIIHLGHLMNTIIHLGHLMKHLEYLMNCDIIPFRIFDETFRIFDEL